MSNQDIHPNKFSELRSIYKYYIDSYNALYQLKTDKEEELISIYKMIKTELIDSKKHLPKFIIKDILNIITYNNRYAKSYLFLAKLKEVPNTKRISKFLFYKEYGIKLDNYEDFEEIKYVNIDIHSENTIYRAIMNDDKDRFIFFIESDGFDVNQALKSNLYPDSKKEDIHCLNYVVITVQLIVSSF
ncbi:hypothetical protein TVAG_078960 [Trichomonas vaginalis G3]|uniref:DUF3447 domain-containing protein n=1 Tax=Trichomonas vaginalis (strain ATCC PRA-98 / G3) TaxID=412133 RepID=A2FUG3_TRIV3|nr:protein ubiquitination [Trichomonas vaginalis G3]EAX91458.1 hypothetical protein TVAG_078960 [Trichomonas vaginalis G3]KAI5510557.1 protein ubiquitination [Trichomonas vaginalis G3]|eukprot:XP_001304388.1 hypothetical protein [Trichomonas vaginalis G3]